MAEEYIKRETVCNLCNNKEECCGKEKCPVYKAPPADVVERKRGEWIIRRWHMASDNPCVDDTYAVKATCPRCNFCIDSARASFGYPNINTTNFCPNCGADLRGRRIDNG